MSSEIKGYKQVYAKTVYPFNPRGGDFTMLIPKNDTVSIGDAIGLQILDNTIKNKKEIEKSRTEAGNMIEQSNHDDVVHEDPLRLAFMFYKHQLMMD